MFGRLKQKFVPANEPVNEPYYKVVELVDGKLDPNSTHLIVFDGAAISKMDANTLVNNLRGAGVRVVVVFTNGNPQDAVRVYSLPDKYTERDNNVQQPQA